MQNPLARLRSWCFRIVLAVLLTVNYLVTSPLLSSQVVISRTEA